MNTTTTSFNPAERECCRQLVDLAWREDLGDAGDLTSLATIPADLRGQVQVVARAAGVVAGLPSLALVAAKLEPPPAITLHLRDGARVARGEVLATVAGPMRGLLAFERTALNFLQHLSGIATLTRQFVDQVQGTRAAILDTRKTTPGWRLLEKYAVRCGGGQSHRVGLYDAILIKDNHLAALGGSPQPIAEAIRASRAYPVTVEIEVDTLEQLREALAAGPDIVLLDNMSAEQMRAAVAMRDTAGAPVLLEASGGVNLATVRPIAETGVDRISVGMLTHSAPALDLAFDFLA